MRRRVTSRPVAATDGDLLAAATLDNLNWSGQRFTIEDVHERPGFRHYTQIEPGRGDFGVVAEHAGEPVGVGWAQFLPAADPGYGFVDESTPEVSLWVKDGYRGQGVGRVLLRQLQEEASRRGITRLSLSVESGNHARRLYSSEGFTPVSGREQDGVMVWVARTAERPTVRAARRPVTSLAVTALGRVVQTAMRARNSFEPAAPTCSTVVRRVRVTTDIRYGQAHPNSYLDVYRAAEGPPAGRPTVVVVHGGGFIAGSKSDGDPHTGADTGSFALGHGPALEAGYNVVCIDYGLAPQVPYPTPVIQLGEAITFLRAHADVVGLDMDRVILSGLSAGGQVVGQYANIQTNPDYASGVGLLPTLDPAHLTAVLLDSAPFDLRTSTRAQAASWRNDLLFGLSLRSYVGLTPERIAEASITDHVTAAFPPAFIADGNTGTFPHQARALATRLAELGVRHELVLYPRSDAELGHGFMTQPSEWTDDYNLRKLAFLADVAALDVP